MTQPAIVADDGAFSYADLDAASQRVAAALLDGRGDLGEGRVAFLVPPSFAYVAVQHGIWRAGGVAVPLAMSHPPAELEYVIRDAGADIVVADPALTSRVAPLAREAGARFQTSAECLSAAGSGSLPTVAASRRAGSTLALEELRQWAGKFLAPYKVPTALRVVDRLPRNAMGKVTKSDVKRLF